MLPWLTNILRWLLVRTASKDGCAAPSTPRFVPDRRFFGALDEVLEVALRLRVSNDPEAAHARSRPAWQDERVDLPLRRPSNRKQAPTEALGVTHNVTHSVTHTGRRSKGAERQARYRARDPEGYQRRHREYMAGYRAKAKAKADVLVPATDRQNMSAISEIADMTSEPVRVALQF
jgi:hypothetical protein